MVYKYFLFLSLVGLMQLTFSCSSSPNEIEPLKPEGEDTPLEKDEYTFMNVEYRRWQNGTFQAWTTIDSRETHTIGNMNWCTPSSNYSQAAQEGRIGLQPSSVAGREGFFRVANCGSRSYLLDPDNGAVIIHGVQRIRPGESTAHKKVSGTRYGSEAQRSEETGKLLVDNHIDYISYGPSRIEVFPAVVRVSLSTSKTQKVAYAENLYLLCTFMWDMSRNSGHALDGDKYSRLVLLFKPTFAMYTDHLVQEKLASSADDRHFIGFYLDNELSFASCQNTDPLRGTDLKHFLSLSEHYKAAREYTKRFIWDNDIASAGAITKENQEDFRGMVTNYYYQLIAAIVRQYDKEHLILGTRLHDWNEYNWKVVGACVRYCDLVSINYYTHWQPEADFLVNLKVWCGTKPLLVSEFYTKVEDASYQGTGYTNTEGDGWLVHTQKSRDEFCQNFYLRLPETRNCVGWVHFEYNDDYDSNGRAPSKGIISIEYEPYESFLSQMRQLNLSAHSLIDYYDTKSVQQIGGDFR